MIEDLNEELVEQIDRHIEELFTPEDAALAQNIQDAEAAGLPAIQVSPNEGKLLFLIARISRAARILEVGTLGGYSTTWLARALPPDGRVTTLELNPAYAEVARRNLARAGVSEQVEILVGNAADSLWQLIREATPPFDLVFLDADKTGYVEYLELALQLSRPGTVILADNVIRGGRVMASEPPDPFDRGARAYNFAIANHPRLESLVLPIIRRRIDGLAISIVK
jgi:predicted O-methyltransferase YrrM